MITWDEALMILRIRAAAQRDHDHERADRANEMLCAFLDQFEGAEITFMINQLARAFLFLNSHNTGTHEK